MAVVTSQPRYAHRNGFGLSAESPNGVRLSAIGADRREFEAGSGQLILTGMTELEYVDCLHVDEQMRRDVKARCGAGNTYSIKTKDGDQLFYAVEDNNCICRWCCGPHRVFHITVYNCQDEPVVHLDRECCRCECCCCVDCCLCQHKLVVRDARGVVLGAVRERFHLFHARLDVVGEDGQVFARLVGPCCPCRCCVEMNVDILNEDDKALGYINKRWPGRQRGVNCDHDSFEVHFPYNATLDEKTVLLGGAFLVDYMLFEMS